MPARWNFRLAGPGCRATFAVNGPCDGISAPSGLGGGRRSAHGEHVADHLAGRIDPFLAVRHAQDELLETLHEVWILEHLPKLGYERLDLGKHQDLLAIGVE